MTVDILPASWLNVKLGDVVDYGKTVKAEPADITDDTWVLELEDIEKDSSKLLQRLTFGDRKSKSTKNRFEAGDVLYGKLRPYLNKIVVADSGGVCSTEIVPLKPSDYLNNQYLFYWMKHPELLAYVAKVGYGVNMPRLGTKDGLAAPFVLAPLAEQQQIAARLDELLAQVDTLKTRLDAIPAILKRFRQSVLAAAVSGKLTEEWRVERGLPDAIESSLSAVLEIVSGLAFKKAQYSGEGSRLLQIANVGYGEMIWDKEAFIPLILADENSRFAMAERDIVMALNRPITNGWLKVAILDNEDLPAILYQRVARMRIKSQGNLLAKYGFLAMRTEGFKKQVEANLKGSDQPYINTSSLAELTIPVPSVQEQTEIVRQVEQLFAFADQIELRVKDAQARVNHLTQSILAKAFRGELTADWREQHQELISGENSVEVLLARIQAERAAMQPAKRTRRKKAG